MQDLHFLKKSELLDAGSPFARTLFNLFEKDNFGSFAGLLREVLGEESFDAGNTAVKLSFVRSGNVLRRISSLPGQLQQRRMFHSRARNVAREDEKVPWNEQARTKWNYEE